MPVNPPPALLAHDTRACLALGYGRVRQARRAAEGRSPDVGRLVGYLDEIEECLTRLAGLVDALEAVGRDSAEQGPDGGFPHQHYVS